MPEKREDADTFKHPALRYIEKKGMSRREAAIALGIPDKVTYLNLVLDRWKGTSMAYAKLFHDVFGIPYEKLVNIPVRLPAREFEMEQIRKQHRMMVEEQEKEAQRNRAAAQSRPRTKSKKSKAAMKRKRT